MDIRASGKKTQEEKVALQPAVAALQENFMLISKNNKKIQSFYLSHVEPLLSQLGSFTSLEDIDSVFKRLCGTSVNSQHTKQVGLFEIEAKEIDSDIREGYIHILELYRLYFMCYFIQTYHLLSQTKEPPLMTSAEVEEKVELVELTTIQSVAIEKSLSAYQSGALDEWSKTVFSPAPTILLGEFQFLRQKTDTFNQKIKKSLSVEEEKFTLDLLEGLLAGEESFVQFQQDLDSLAAEQKQLELEQHHFIQESDQAILSLEITENLHRAALKSTPPFIHFDNLDRQVIAKTAECIKIVSQYSSEQNTFEHKQVSLQATLNSIIHLQEWLITLQQSCQYKSFLGSFSMRHKIAVLLKEAIEALKNICVQYREKTLGKTKSDMDVLMAESRSAYRQAVKNIVKQCRIQIRKKLNDAIQPLQQAALAAREQKRLGYLSELKLQFAVTPIDTDSLKLLCEKQLQRAVQLDKAWQLMMGQIIKPYQDEFAKIKVEVAASSDSETSDKILGQLGKLYNEVDLRRYLLLVKMPDGSQWDPTRREGILRLINKLASLMLCIRQAQQDLLVVYVKQQLSLYRSRFLAIEAELKSVVEKVRAMQMLERELREFTSQHKALDKMDAQILQDIERYLSYENLRRAEIEEQVESYRASFLKLGSTVIGRRQIPQLKEDFYAWCDQEKKLIWNECSSQPRKVDKYNYIIKPVNDFVFYIGKAYPSAKTPSMPEFSVGWALFWTIVVPIIGYCIYSWWYNRQCCQAMASSKKRKSIDLHVKIPTPSVDSDCLVKSAMGFPQQNLKRRGRRVARGDEVFSEKTIAYHMYDKNQTSSLKSPHSIRQEVQSAQFPVGHRHVRSAVH